MESDGIGDMIGAIFNLNGLFSLALHFW